MIGKYKLRFLILPRVLGSAGSNNEREETWPDPPATDVRFFAARETMTGGETIVQGLRMSTGGMKIRARGRAISITDKDRIKNVATGELWNVTGMYRDEDSTVLTIERVTQQATAQ
jgi:hypothetical protein